MKKFLMIFAFGIVAGNIGFAQKAKTTTTPAATGAMEQETAPHTGLKFGWIVSGELLSMMPDKIKADTDISRFARDFQTQIESMMKEYQTKVQKFQNDEKTMSEAIKEVKMKEIQDLQNRIESIQQSAKEKVDQKQRDLYQPILDKAEKAINAVAKEKGYDYIFDKNGGTLLYGRDSDNILPFVKAKLGIK
jgi:outer membrane protein